MERRHFIITGGGFLLASALASCVGGQSPAASSAPSARRRYLPADAPTPILKAVCLAMNAPNPHNTQAWKFLIHSDTSMSLYIDESRLLPQTDPGTRQIHIGAGCFLELLSLGAPTLGYDAKVELLPKGEYAADRAGKLPVAMVSLEPGAQRPEPLLEGLYSRHTNRKAYRRDSPGQAGFRDILRAAKVKDGVAEMVDEPARLADILDLCYRGMEIESRLRRTNEESRVWFRGNEDAMVEKRDGTTLEGNGLSGMRKFFAERYLQGGNPERWHAPGSIDSYLKSYRKTLEATSAVVLFKTRTNTMRDWLTIGGDYVRFQIAADLKEWYLHPMSQVLQEFPEMRASSEELTRLTAVEPEGKVQMLVRMGRADRGFQSYRKNPSDLVIRQEPALL